MAIRHLSRNARGWGPALALGLAAAGLAWGCASGREQEVQRLQARAAYEQGLRHLQDKRLSLGIVALREAITLDPEQSLYRNALGVVYLDMRQAAEAQKEFERAVAADPSYAEAQHNLGLAHAEQGRFAEAIAQYRKAIAQPTYATPEIAYHNMGIAYLNLGRLPEAEEAFRVALRLDGKLVGSHFGLGTVLSRMGRMEEARAAFKTARDLDPKSPFGQAAAEALRALGDGG